MEAAYLSSHCGWYKTQRERGALLAAQFPHRFKRVAVIGEASAVKKDAEATPHPGPHPLQGQLPLALAVA